MELELQRLNFQETQKHKEDEQTRRCTRNPNQKTRRYEEETQTRKRENTKKKPKQKQKETRNRRDQTQTEITKKALTNPDLLNPNRSAQTLGNDCEDSKGDSGEAQSEGLPNSFIFLFG